MAPRIVAVGEVADGALTKLSAEVATLARTLAEASGGEAIGLIVDPQPDAAAAELATYLPRVVAVASAASGAETWAPHATAELGRLIDEGATHALVGATTDGKDLAGMVVGRWTWGLLANAGGVTWDGDGPVVEATVLGGKAISRSAFTGGPGIVTVRPNATTAEPAATAGEVERRDAVGAGERRGRGGQGARAGRRGRRRGVARGGADRRRRRAWRREPRGLRGGHGAGQRSWAAWSAPRGRRWTPAGSRTRGRSGRRARSSSRRCTSGWASRAPCSTGWGCSRPMRS